MLSSPDRENSPVTDTLNWNVGNCSGFILSSTTTFSNTNLPLWTSYWFTASIAIVSFATKLPDSLLKLTNFAPFGKLTSSTLYVGASSVANHVNSWDVYVSSALIATSIGCWPLTEILNVNLSLLFVGWSFIILWIFKRPNNFIGSFINVTLTSPCVTVPAPFITFTSFAISDSASVTEYWGAFSPAHLIVPEDHVLPPATEISSIVFSPFTTSSPSIVNVPLIFNVNLKSLPFKESCVTTFLIEIFPSWISCNLFMKEFSV